MFDRTKKPLTETVLRIILASLLITSSILLAGCEGNPLAQEDSLEIVSMISEGEKADYEGVPAMKVDILIRNTGEDPIYEIEVNCKFLNENGDSVKTIPYQYEGVLLPGQTGRIDIFIHSNTYPESTFYESLDSLTLTGSYSYKKAPLDGGSTGKKMNGKLQNIPEPIDLRDPQKIEVSEAKSCENSELDGEIKLSDEKGIVVDSMTMVGEILEVELSNTSDQPVEIGGLFVGAIDDSGNVVDLVLCHSDENMPVDETELSTSGYFDLMPGKSMVMRSDSIAASTGYEFSHVTALSYYDVNRFYALATIPKAISIY